MGHIELDVVVLAAVVVGGGVALLSALARRARRRRRGSIAGEALLDGALAASVAVVLVATLSPLGQFGSRLDRVADVNLRPFELMHGAPVAFAVINVLLLVPTIVLLAQRWRRAGVIRLTLAGALLSVAVETAQLVHPARGTNVDDLILNTAGAFVAAVAGVSVRVVLRRRSRQRRGLAQRHQPIERGLELTP